MEEEGRVCTGVWSVEGESKGLHWSVECGVWRERAGSALECGGRCLELTKKKADWRTTGRGVICGLPKAPESGPGRMPSG